jgi:iron complex outermembrane receptor protein
MRRVVFYILFLSLQTISFGTTVGNKGIIISGRLTDDKGLALPGASITIENSLMGVLTGAEGNYSLTVPASGNYVVKYSFIGYESEYRNLNLISDTIINVTLLSKSYLTEEVLVNATRAGEHAPLAYTTVTRADISKNNSAQDIPYLIGNTPSLVVSSDAGTGVGYTNINIRGSDVKRINVTIDGIPVNDAESHGVWWVDLPDIASSADNIQIQRGVGSSTNGAGAFGATINFQTSDLHREAYAELNSSYGSFNTSKNTISFGTGLINKKFAIDGRLSKIWSDGYIDRAFSDLKSFYVSGTMYGKSSMLKLLIFSGTERTYQAWNGVPKDSLKTHRTYNQYSYKNETDNYWQDNYQLHYSKEFVSGLSANVALHYTKGKGYYENLVNSEFSEYNLPNAIINNDTVTSTAFITQRWLRNDFYGFTYSLKYSKNKLNAVIGGGWNRYTGNHFGDIIWAKIVTYDNESYRWYHGTGDKKDLNNFIKLNYSLSDKLNLYADLQFRNIYYRIGGTDEYLKDVSQVHKYNFFNPKTGVTYNFNKKQKVFASFGISQREPDRGNFTDADPGKIPVPEKLYDYEAAYEFHSERLMFRSNLFYMYYADQLILTGKINNVGSPILTNVPTSYRQGIELESGIQILNNLNWNGNLTFSRNIIRVYTDYTDNWDTGIQEEEILKNKTISFSPSVIASSAFDYSPLKNFHLLLNTKYVGKQYIDNTENNNRMLNSYMLNNLLFMYSFTNKLFKELNLEFAVNNLLDKKYETNAWVYKYNEGGEQHILDGYFPQAGINYMFRLEIKF